MISGVNTEQFPSAGLSDPQFAKVAECLYRHTSSGTYYGLVKRSGKQFRRSLKTKDRQLAGRRLAEFRDKLERIQPGSLAPTIQFGEVAELWQKNTAVGLKPNAVRRRLFIIGQLNQFFGKIAVRKITRALCDEWAAKRSPLRAASTFNSERDCLRAVLNYSKREGVILDSPAEHVPRRRMTKTAPQIPSRDQFALMLSEMRKLDVRAQEGAVLVKLLATSGMRLSEATSFRWRDIDFDRGSFLVTGGEQGTKNHEMRTVPLFPPLRRFLKDLSKLRKPEPDDLVVGISSGKRAIGTACKKAGVPEFTHHSLRHFFVSNAIEIGADFKVIAAWVGHKDGGILVAKTYGHLRDTHSFELAKKMT
jgi:integrase